MSKLHEVAKRVVAGANEGSVTAGKEKISVDDIIYKYPKGVSINGMDIICLRDGGQFAVFTFAEDKSKCFSGGKSLTEMAEAWMKEYAGDILAINKDLANEPVKIKMRKMRTKANRTFTKVDVINEYDDISPEDLPF